MAEKTYADMTPEERAAELERLRNQAVGYEALTPSGPAQPSETEQGIAASLLPVVAPALGAASIPLAGLRAATGISPWDVAEAAKQRLLQTPFARAGARLFGGASAEEAANMSAQAAATSGRLGKRFAASRLGGALSELAPGVVGGGPEKPPPFDVEGELPRRFAEISERGVVKPEGEQKPRMALTARIENGRTVFTQTPIGEGGEGADEARKAYERGLGEFAASRMASPAGPTVPIGGGRSESFTGGPAGAGTFSPIREIPSLSTDWEEIRKESPAVQEAWLRDKGIKQGLDMQQLQQDQLRLLAHPESFVTQIRDQVRQDPVSQTIIAGAVRAAAEEAKKAGRPFDKEAFDTTFMLAEDKIIRARLDEALKRATLANPQVAASAYQGSFRSGY